MTSQTSPIFKTILMSSATIFAVLVAVPAIMAPAAYADDCLLDRNDDGNADLSDDDGGPNPKTMIINWPAGWARLHQEICQQR